MHGFWCQNILIIPLYILLTKTINTFWSKGIIKFWFGGISTFWVHKITQEESSLFTEIFRIISTFNLELSMPDCVNIHITRTTHTT